MAVPRNKSKIHCERISLIAVVCFYKIATLFLQSALKEKSDVITLAIEIKNVSVCVSVG